MNLWLVLLGVGYLILELFSIRNQRLEFDSKERLQGVKSQFG